MYKLGVMENKKNNNVYWTWFDEFDTAKTRGCYNTKEEALKAINNLNVEIKIPESVLDYTIL